MNEITVHLDLGDNTSITALHLHVVDNDPKLEAIMAGVAELMAKVSEVQATATQTLDNTVELVKDVQRLLAQGDTQGAIDALSNVQAGLTQARDSLAALDTDVETASPEPTPAPVETATTEDSSVDDLLNQ